MPRPVQSGGLTHAASWNAPLPHAGSLSDLVGWWDRFNDPELPELIKLAQNQNPDVELAWARVTQARAVRELAPGAGSPVVNAGGRAVRSRLEQPVSSDRLTTRVALLDASWEIDLFGSRRTERAAAQARALSGEFAWHEARVSLASEVASTFLSLRACEAATVVLRRDAQSAQFIAQLVALRTQQGFDEPLRLEQAQLDAQDARAARGAQDMECDIAVRTLSALVVLPERALRERLQANQAVVPEPEAFEVAPLPLELLSQRPDLASAEQAVAAAAADIGSAESQRWPKLTLSVDAGSGVARLAGQRANVDPFSLALGLLAPVIDGGARAANVDAAKARHAEAQAAWRGKALQALREVEVALTRVAAAAQREAQARAKVNHQLALVQAARLSFQQGQTDRIETEMVRRKLHSLQLEELKSRQERLQHWVSLYKALGGGWRRPAAGTDSGAAGTEGPA